LKPFDFVRISPPETADKKIGEFYAIVHEIEQVSDESSALSSFVSADFGLAEIAPRIGRVVTTYADAAVLFNTEDIEMPVPHGARVHWPDEIGVRRALGILDFERGTPAGYITMSGPEQETLTIHVDLDTGGLPACPLRLHGQRTSEIMLRPRQQTPLTRCPHVRQVPGTDSTRIRQREEIGTPELVSNARQRAEESDSPTHGP